MHEKLRDNNSISTPESREIHKIILSYDSVNTYERDESRHIYPKTCFCGK